MFADNNYLLAKRNIFETLLDDTMLGLLLFLSLQ